jgi:hypothetical protein
MMFDGVDYGAGYSYFSQWSRGDAQSYTDAKPDLTVKAEFWRLVRSGTPKTPWLPTRMRQK